MAYNYVVTAQKPTAVFSSVVCNFTAATDTNLILSKCTRLDVSKITPTGPEKMFEVPIYGRICVMFSFRPKNSEKDLLFFCTENYKFSVLDFDEKKQEIRTFAYGDARDKIGRPAEHGPVGVIDPDNGVIGLHLYDGMLKVIPIDANGKLEEAFNVRLQELHIRDMALLAGCEKPTLIALYQDHREQKHVKTYELRLKEKDFIEGPWSQPNLEAGADLLIPIPAPFGGALIVGQQSIAYVKRGVTNSIEIEPCNIKSYGAVDKDGTRYLLGDYRGNMYVLVLVNDGTVVQELKIEKIGSTTIPSTISYLDNSYVFVGSTFGDSQLVHINPDGPAEDKLEIVDTKRFGVNLGPILDFCVVDLERQGQGQVVACCGAYKEGALATIRSGIGVNELGELEYPGVKGMWTLTTDDSLESFDKYLVISLVAETRFICIEGEDMEDVREVGGFEGNAQTLAITNSVGDTFLQVTPKCVRLVEARSLKLLSDWSPKDGEEINVTSLSPSQVALSTGGGKLVYLEVENRALKMVSERALEHEISCLSISPLGEATASDICAVGLWNDMSVRLLRLPNLEEITKEMDGESFLLCALGDGHLFTFSLDRSSGILSGKKRAVLGNKPVVLRQFYSKDHTEKHVFASSDRPTVIYSSNKKVSFSNVNLPEVTYMTPLHTEGFPNSLVIATEGNIIIGTIDDIQQLHINKYPLGVVPRRIAHQPSSRTFMVLTECAEGREPDGLRLLDDQTFDLVDSMPLQPGEMAQSIVSCSFNTDAEEVFYVVGTAMVTEEEPEPSDGRILVLKVTDRKMQVAVEKSVRGAVYSMASFNGRLLTTINSSVMLFQWQYDSEAMEDDGAPQQPQLTHVADHKEHILALYLATRGDFIVVGDLMSSICLLRYNAMDEAIEEIARDYNANWMTAVEALDDDNFIGGENSFNLFTVRKNAEAATDEEKNRLEPGGRMHLGDFVNRFHHGSLVMRIPDGESLKINSLLFGTVNGAIGVVAQINEDDFRFLEKMQERLRSVVRGVGGLDHREWRSFRNDRTTVEAFNFIDGDLIETFLELPREKQDEVVKGLLISVEDLVKKIETLAQALH